MNWKFVLIAITVAVGWNALIALRDARGASSRVERRAQLVTFERARVREVEHAKTTLRFFERHPRLLYSRLSRVKRKAWHDVGVARQHVIRGRAALGRIRAEQSRLARPLIAHRREWLCIHGGEAPWNYDKDAPGHNGHYDGGLQMDEEFQKDYGSDLLSRKGTADHWTPDEQMMVAERALRTRGFWPWPRTARACGLLP